MNVQATAEIPISIRRWKTYRSYKDSGIKWLGAIPEDWEVKRIKFLASFHGGGTPSKENLDYWNGDIPWISPKDMKSEAVNDSEDHITKEGLAGSATQLVQKGAVLVVVRSGILKHSIPVAVNTKAVALNQDMKAMVPRSSLSPHYLKYLIVGHQNALLVEWRKAGATVESIEHELLVNSCFPVPSLPEQLSIVDLLDRETAKIDALVANKERLIALLLEKRAALITRAVTKGLPSIGSGQATPKVPMKDSGVEWLGEIPAHWEVTTVKRRASRIQTGSTPPTEVLNYYEDGTVPWFGPGSFGTDLVLIEPVKLIAQSAVDAGVARVFVPGSTMIVTIGATIGKVGYIEYAASSNQQITAVTFDTRTVYPKFGAYQLKRLEPILQGIAPSTTLPIFDQSEVGYLPFTTPPLEEQQAIVLFLDGETTKIDAMIAKIREGIEKLKEYRTALISAAVTGKIDVREQISD